MQGRFIGLPSHPVPGPMAGETDLVGRLWVQDCAAASRDGNLALRLGGIGWTWVDERQSGFRVAQYVYFRADATVFGGLATAYDPNRRLASVWFAPGAPPQVSGYGIGAVQAHATNPFTSMVSFFIDADARAQERMQEELVSRLGAAFSPGFTLTHDLWRGQTDFMLQALPPGSSPQRPFNDGLPWVANERVTLHPGSVQVAGPFDPAFGAVLDIAVERGNAMRWRTECEAAVMPAMSSVAAGRAPMFPPPAEDRRVSSAVPLAVAVQMPCRWYLVVEAVDSEVMARFRVRASTRAVLLPP